jgi:hypothetical protein
MDFLKLSLLYVEICLSLLFFTFEIILAPGLVEKLEAGFRFRSELMDMARETVRKILAKHESKQSESKKKKKTKKDKKKKEYTFVGIQSR